MLEMGVLLLYMFLFATQQVFLVGNNIKRMQFYHIGVWVPGGLVTIYGLWKLHIASKKMKIDIK